MTPTKTWPVAEVFGPTLQGEGIDQGRPCYFVRFGGCDFKCEWCDTPHAVLPQNVRHLPRMTETQILDALQALPKGPSWVVFSGGNPALHELSGLCEAVRDLRLKVAVETQGTRFKPWLATHTGRLCVSPKPPSSGMKYTPDDLMDFLGETMKELVSSLGRIDAGERFYSDWLFLKVVIFDHNDYGFAKTLWRRVNEESGGLGLPFYLSAGNDAGATVGNPSRRDSRSDSQVRDDLMQKSLWLANRVMVDDEWAQYVTVQSQYHVLLWGNKQGV